MNLELTKCDSCKELKPVVLRVVVNRHVIRVCIDCHTADEESSDKQYGTHKPGYEQK